MKLTAFTVMLLLTGCNSDDAWYVIQRNGSQWTLTHMRHEYVVSCSEEGRIEEDGQHWPCELPLGKLPDAMKVETMQQQMIITEGPERQYFKIESESIRP